MSDETKTSGVAAWAYSRDEEEGFFGAESREAALLSAVRDFDLKPGAVAFVGPSFPIGIHIDAGSTLEHIAEQAADECGDAAYEWHDQISESRKASLEGLLNAALDRWLEESPELRPEFFTVHPIEKVEITEALIASAGGQS